MRQIPTRTKKRIVSDWLFRQRLLAFWDRIAWAVIGGIGMYLGLWLGEWLDSFRAVGD